MELRIGTVEGAGELRAGDGNVAATEPHGLASRMIIRVSCFLEKVYSEEFSGNWLRRLLDIDVAEPIWS